MPIRDDDEFPEVDETEQDQAEPEDKGGQEDLLEQEVPELSPEEQAANMPTWAYTEIPLEAMELAQLGDVGTQRDLQMTFWPVIDRVVKRVLRHIPSLRERGLYSELFEYGFEAAAQAILDYKPIYKDDGTLAFAPGSAVYYRIKRAVDKQASMELGNNYNTRKQIFKMLSMDTPIGDDPDDEATLHKKIEDPKEREKASQNELQRHIHKIIDSLPELQGRILRARFYDGLEIRQIMAKLKISQSKLYAELEKAFAYIKSVYGTDLQAALDDFNAAGQALPKSSTKPTTKD